MRRKEDASAFIIALGILVILFIMAITFATMMVMESRAARNYNDAALCEDVAYGALEEAINALFRDKYGEDASVVAGNLVLEPYDNSNDQGDENWDFWAYEGDPNLDETLWFQSDGGYLSEDASATDVNLFQIKDAGKSWLTSPDIWQDAMVQVAGQMRTVDSNGTNTITVTEAFDPEPKQGDRYMVFFWYPRDAAGDATLKALPGGLSARYAILITDDREARVNVNTAGNLADAGARHGSNMGASVTEVSLEALLQLFNERDGSPISAADAETLARDIILARCTPPGGGTTEPGSDTDDDGDIGDDGVDNNGDGEIDETDENENEDDEFNSLFAVEDTPFALPDEARILGPAADTGDVTSAGAAYLTDNTKSWIDNEWTDAVVGVDNAGADGILDEFRRVTSNTSDTLDVSPDWGTNPSAGDAYYIPPPSPLEAILAKTNVSLRAEATGTAGLTLADSLTTYSAGTIEHPYIDSGEIADLSDRFRRYRFPLTGHMGTVDNASNAPPPPTLTDSSKAWTDDEWIDAFVSVDTDADGIYDEVREITDNTSDTLTVNPSWGTIPSVGDPYYIFDREDLRLLLENKAGLTTDQAYQMIVNLKDALDGDSTVTDYTPGATTYYGVELRPFITEVMREDDTGPPPRAYYFIEFYNPSPDPITVGGWDLNITGGPGGSLSLNPDSIPGNGFYVIGGRAAAYVDSVEIGLWQPLPASDITALELVETDLADDIVVDKADGFAAFTSAGTVTFAIGDTLTDNTKSWIVDEWAGATVYVDTGNNGDYDEVQTVSTNTSDTLTVSVSWGTTPSAGEPYYLESGSQERHDFKVNQWTKNGSGQTFGSGPYTPDDTHPRGFDEIFPLFIVPDYLDKNNSGSIFDEISSIPPDPINYNINLANLSDLSRFLLMGYTNATTGDSISQMFSKDKADGNADYWYTEGATSYEIKFDISDTNHRQVLDYLTILNPLGDGYDDDGDGVADDIGPDDPAFTDPTDDLGGPEHRIPGMININTASKEVLMALPGVDVDADLADAIIANRPYTDIGELLEKDGGGIYLVTGIDALATNTQDDNGNGIVDEKEEEFLIFGALSNIVTTRSNVFTVYCLAQVGIWNDLNDDDIVDPDEFTIFAERRLMAIVDRSTQPINVRFQRWLTD